MTITINGTPAPVPDDTTIAELLARLGVDASARGVAVAVNGEVVPRSAWASRRVAGDDRVEAVSAMQGG